MTRNDDEIRPLPESVPPVVSARVKKILAGVPDEARVAFVATVTNAQDSLNPDARVAVMIRMGKGWSFSTFTEKPYRKPLVYGAELRFVR